MKFVGGKENIHFGLIFSNKGLSTVDKPILKQTSTFQPNLLRVYFLIVILKLPSENFLFSFLFLCPKNENKK